MIDLIRMSADLKALAPYGRRPGDDWPEAIKMIKLIDAVSVPQQPAATPEGRSARPYGLPSASVVGQERSQLAHSALRVHRCASRTPHFNARIPAYHPLVATRRAGTFTAS